MALKIDSQLRPAALKNDLERVFELNAQKVESLHQSWDPGRGTPVFTIQGRYTTRGWTEWTQGFQYGMAILQFDATGDSRFLDIGRNQTRDCMAPHLSHIGVHDHGFNNISTYGNLLRLLREGKIQWNDTERDFYEVALKVSGAVQAARWTAATNGLGFIHSFNGPHSLFIDTLRSLRSLAVAHSLGHVLMSEHDEKISLLERLLVHAETTAHFGIYYGEGRDAYDIRGRTAHESIFNMKDGHYRCPNSQQGFSPFTTWTRGLAWAVCGYPEQLEFLDTVPDHELVSFGGRERIESMMLKAATATADFFIENGCADGIPMWDTGAPNLHKLGNYLEKTSNPFNDWEPVDSSAAAISAQGLLRLGNFLIRRRHSKNGEHYRQAALTVARTLFQEPYLSAAADHQGLLLHTVYHRPNGWDHIPSGRKVPSGESALWGDYHALELALMLLREIREEPYYTFFGCLPGVPNNKAFQQSST